MNRVRISTTVDPELLDRMRQSRRWPSDAALFDAALAALDAAEQATHIDAAYVRAYDAHPADEPDEYGELGAWREAAGGS